MIEQKSKIKYMTYWIVAGKWEPQTSKYLNVN